MSPLDQAKSILRMKVARRTSAETRLILGQHGKSKSRKKTLALSLTGAPQAGSHLIMSRVVHEGRRLRATHTNCLGLCDHQLHMSGAAGAILWPLIFSTGHEIAFAHTSFKWANLASHNAGVYVALWASQSGRTENVCILWTDGETFERKMQINAYLVHGPNIIVKAPVIQRR